MKNQKPAVNSRYKSGVFVPSNPQKYVGDLTKIYFRSGYEFEFMKFLDRNDNVIGWANEPCGISYFSVLDKRPHTYYVDFAIIVKDQYGVESRWIIEVKPTKFLEKPNPPTRLTDKSLENYLYASKQYIVNRCKFDAARDYAASIGFKFGIVTENFLFKKV